ncbi:NfeD family protein [Thiohalomonas denitrificans]|uniref:NfeD family protein n=1 Tax=Thiohalomonas denitrificans TaxID=415747 RepID=UPI0026F30A02|nr:NfeD family protein [Thiohalomonas denitrificans]
MSAATVWIIAGIVLILSELLATSIIAVFIGIGAITVGVLLQLGWIESLASQLTVFGLVSIISLVLARRQMKGWFGGFSTDQGEAGSRFQRDIGERVTVQDDFVHGAGRVVLNGVAWDAVSEEKLKAGDVAWVVSNEGIRLTVSSQRPKTKQ